MPARIETAEWAVVKPLFDRAASYVSTADGAHLRVTQRAIVKTVPDPDGREAVLAASAGRTETVLPDGRRARANRDGDSAQVLAALCANSPDGHLEIVREKVPDVQVA